MVKKKPAFYTGTMAMGDCLCATPTVRKLSQIYGEPVRVFSHYPDIFKRLPYVSLSDDIKEWSSKEKENWLQETYDLHYTFFKIGKMVHLSDPRGVEIKHSQMDIRQYHAFDLGFNLRPDELHCNFVPEKKFSIKLPKEFVVLHPSNTWASRSWATEKWTELCKKLIDEGKNVVIVGKDGIDKNMLDYVASVNADANLVEEMKSKDTSKILDERVLDLTNSTTLSDLWHIIDRAESVVTMDSGILHVAGTTETNIIHLGSSIDPKFRAPYRHGDQEHMYTYVEGSCVAFCASDPKYSLEYWEEGYSPTPIQFLPNIENCLQKRDNFDCHPSVEDVIEAVNTEPNFPRIAKMERILLQEFFDSAYEKSHKDKEPKFTLSEIKPPSDINIKVTYLDGAKVEILGEDWDDREFQVSFIDNDTGENIHSTTLEINHWSQTNRKWYTNWKIQVKVEGDLIHEDIFDPTGKKILVIMRNRALGDTIAWAPFVEEFRKKHDCKVTALSDWGEMFNRVYPKIRWKSQIGNPRAVIEKQMYAVYDMRYGPLLNDNRTKILKQLNKNAESKRGLLYAPDMTMFDDHFQKRHPHKIPLQATGADILGLEYTEIRPKVNDLHGTRPIEKPYVCIAEKASAPGLKEWNNQIGWKALAEGLKEMGYEVVSIAKENTNTPGVIHRNGNFPIEDRINYLRHCEFFVGLGSGLSWLAWACNTRVVMIAGHTVPWHEFTSNCTRVTNTDVCHGCWNGEHADKFALFHIDYCPEDKRFECSRKISPKMVLDKIEEDIRTKNDRVLIKIVSTALGDNIGAMGMIDLYSRKRNKAVDVICNRRELFTKSYPDFVLYDKETEPEEIDGMWKIGDREYSDYKRVHYKFDMPLMGGYAQQLGIKYEPTLLKIDHGKSERPMKEKYFCFSMHSTAQAKHWNNEKGWDDLCKVLSLKGYVPVCIDWTESFGNEKYRNQVPEIAEKKLGLSIQEVIPWLKHADFFVGLSSGMAWVAHALQVPTVLISNFTSKDHEFEGDNVIRVVDESVCHACFHTEPFDSGDWEWCPRHKDTEDQFICSKVIEPETVLKLIEQKFLK